MFAKLWEWVTNLFTPKGYSFYMPDMHLKAIPKHGEEYIVEIEGDSNSEESCYHDTYVMNDMRINPNPEEVCICFSEEMLQPGYQVWIPRDTLKLWTSYFTKFRIQIKHKETGEVYMGWQLMDYDRCH